MCYVSFSAISVKVTDIFIASPFRMYEHANFIVGRIFVDLLYVSLQS